MFKTKLTFISSLLLACSCAGNSSTSTPEEAPRPLQGIRRQVPSRHGLNGRRISGEDSLGQAAALKHFNSFVAENVMKCEEIHPERDRYFRRRRRIYQAGRRQRQAYREPLPYPAFAMRPMVFKDEKGERVSADTLKRRMRDHIHAVVSRYKAG